ncbi:MAG: 4Fe-4S binding protein, partial [Desulfobacteraceae bacterium]|nr:4Fe-4S binding protein [Desulfobacteraceae bacterium]
TIKTIDGKGMLAYSNFEVAVDEESCTGCGECVERCPLDAMSIEEDVVSINRNHCVGCGNCNSVCPEEALSMVRRSHHNEPPKLSKEESGFTGM